MPRNAYGLLNRIVSEQSRSISRRGLLSGGAKLAAGGTLAIAIAGSPSFGAAFARAQDSTMSESPFEDDIAVLNYALTLEHLEAAFYRDGTEMFTFGTDPFNNSINDMVAAIREHEMEHVTTLTDVITQLGGTPVSEATYDFGFTDANAFLVSAASIENLGVSAYDGAGMYIADPGLLTAAGSIVAVEARHAAYLNLITGLEPFPSAYETPMSPDAVLEIAGPFIQM